MTKVNKFTIEDIHKIREDLYEKSKKTSTSKVIMDISKIADEADEKIKDLKKKKLAI
ncbi:MAG: hypothetical protein FWC53_02755 [Firmicutes bacterium]|nr:hypothetical protein [Bacillota bacterium]